MNILSLFIIFFLTMFVFVDNTEAKILPQASRAGIKQSAGKPNGTTISVSPRLRGDRRALNVNFSNLKNAKSVSYMMVYRTNGQQEAAQGSLNLNSASSQTSELLFGTCSKNVCRFHTNIKDARLEVSYTSNSGKKYLKKFKIKL